jgi:hypothetical protein
VIAAAPATLEPTPRTCTSRQIGVVRHVCDGGEGREGGGGGTQIGEEEGAGVGAPGQMHIIRHGAFLTIEHLLATMVSLPGSPLSVGQAMVICFLYRLLTLTRGPRHYFFLN